MIGEQKKIDYVTKRSYEIKIKRLKQIKAGDLHKVHFNQKIFLTSNN